MYFERDLNGKIIQSTPYVGCPATKVVGSDSYAYVVTEINKTGITITLAQAVKVKGKWVVDITRGERLLARQNKKGVWMEYGKSYNSSYRCVVVIGQACDYRDPSF